MLQKGEYTLSTILVILHASVVLMFIYCTYCPDANHTA